MRNDLSMNRIDNSGKGIAGLGRGEDTMLAHVAPGEMVVPPVISPQTQEIIKKEMMAVGLDPNEYTVGDGMSINPITGMAEFGWLKKTFKSIGKVVKKVAPVAVSFIPGIGPVAKGALTAAVGKASGMDTKSALLGGLTAGVGAKFMGSGSGSGIGGLKGTSGNFFGKGGTFRNILGAGKEYVMPGADGRGLFKNLLGFGQQTPQFEPILDASGMPTGMYQEVGIPGSSFSIQELRDAGFMDNAGNLVSQSQGGGFFDRIMGGGTPGQSRIGLIEDFLKGKPSDPVRGGLFGGQQGQGGIGGMLGGMGGGFGGIDPNIALLAGLYGSAVKSSYKDREGGMKDIRQSIRPDLMPAPTFTGFDLGIRKQAATGGPMEITQIVSRPPEDLRVGLMSGPPIKEELEDRKEYLTFILNSKNEDNIKKEGGRMAVLQELNSISKELAGGFVGLNNAQIRQNKANESMRSVLKGLREPKATGGVAELDMRGGGPSIGPGTGTSDDIPAMLSDGEFVMTSAANNGLGGFKVTKTETGIELIPNGKPDRQKGAQNMDKLMKTFEQFNKIGQA